MLHSHPDATLCVCVFPRYSAHGCTWHGQGDPGPVPGGASGQRHGGAPGWIIWDHHRHCQAHWRQRQPSTLHPEWVTQQLTQPPTWNDWLPGTDRQHNRKMTVFGHAALSVCTHMYSNCMYYLPPPPHPQPHILYTHSRCRSLTLFETLHYGLFHTVPDQWDFNSLERRYTEWAVSHCVVTEITFNYLVVFVWTF